MEIYDKTRGLLIVISINIDKGITPVVTKPLLLSYYKIYLIITYRTVHLHMILNKLNFKQNNYSVLDKSEGKNENKVALSPILFGILDEVNAHLSL